MKINKCWLIGKLHIFIILIFIGTIQTSLIGGKSKNLLFSSDSLITQVLNGEEFDKDGFISKAKVCLMNLNSVKNDTVRIKVLIRIGEYYFSKDKLDSSIYFYQELEKVMNKDVPFSLKSKWLTNYSRVLRMYGKFNVLQKLLYVSGHEIFSQDELKDDLKLFFKVYKSYLALYQRNNYTIDEFVNRINYFKSTVIIDELLSFEKTALLYHFHKNYNNVDSALIYVRQLTLSGFQNRNRFLQISAQLLLADYYLNLESNYDSVRSILSRLKLKDVSESSMNLCEYWSMQGLLKLKNFDFKGAIPAFISVLKVGKKEEYPIYKILACSNLVFCHEQSGDMESVQLYQNLMHEKINNLSVFDNFSRYNFIDISSQSELLKKEILLNLEKIRKCTRYNRMYLLVIVLISISVILFLFMMFKNRKLKRLKFEKEKLDLQKKTAESDIIELERIVTEEFNQNKLLESELKALRCQINPHYLSNSLTGLQNLILEHKVDKAIDYIGLYGKVMRAILDNSEYELISIEKEIQTLTDYIEFENIRFSHQLDFKFHYIGIEESEIGRIMMPTMLLQPIVENSLKHGLIPKRGEELLLDITFNLTDVLRITIQDNGVGRTFRESNSQFHVSKGIPNIEQRLDIYGRKYGQLTGLKITDLKDISGMAIGTKVELVIPFIQ